MLTDRMNMKGKTFLLSFFICAATCPLQLAFADQLVNCDLVTFKGVHFANSARVHSGFHSSITRIDAYAAKCGVKVLVTSSFRKKGRPVPGPTVVPPATHSNHFVGHAIDMNLYESGALCNSACLSNPPEKFKGVKCFISNIQRDSVLRWGETFHLKDPVHIDDALNVRDRPLYAQLFVALQKYCN